MKKKCLIAIVILIGLFSQLLFTFAEGEDEEVVDFPRMYSVPVDDNVDVLLIKQNMTSECRIRY